MDFYDSYIGSKDDLLNTNLNDKFKKPIYVKGKLIFKNNLIIYKNEGYFIWLKKIELKKFSHIITVDSKGNFYHLYVNDNMNIKKFIFKNLLKDDLNIKLVYNITDNINNNKIPFNSGNYMIFDLLRNVTNFVSEYDIEGFSFDNFFRYSYTKTTGIPIKINNFLIDRIFGNNYLYTDTDIITEIFSIMNILTFNLVKLGIMDNEDRVEIFNNIKH